MTLPYSNTQTDVNDAGVNYDVYYKFTAPAGSRVIGAWGFSSVGATYRPIVTCYLGPAGAPTQLVSGTAIQLDNRPIYFPVDPASEYFLKFAKNVDTAGPESILVDVLVAPLDIISRGNILVNDDTENFPMAVLSHTTNDVVINYIKNIVAGEVGDILDDGTLALDDRFTGADDTVAVYNSSYTLIATRQFTDTLIALRKCIGLNKFYGLTQASPPELRDILSTGAFGSVNIPALTGLGFPGPGMAVSNDGTIMYYCTLSAGSAVKRWDIVNNVIMSDLVAGEATFLISDMLVLSDDTVVVMFYKAAAAFIRSYTSAGVLIQEYTIGVIIPSGATVPKLAYALNDPSTFWSRHHNDPISTFTNWTTTTGVAATTLTFTEYETGENQADETATPVRFGASISCPFMIVPLSATAGLFKIVPDKRTDTDGTDDVAIPTPTFKTALMP
jgi:hypothetical protein